MERFSFGGAFDAAAANALDADAHALDGAIDFNLDALQIGVEASPADAGDLSADADPHAALKSVVEQAIQPGPALATLVPERIGEVGRILSEVILYDPSAFSSG